MNLVILFIWLPTHATSFIVIAKKPAVFALQKENVHCINFVASFLQTMSLEEFLIRNRNNEQNLLRLVHLFWPYFRKMRLFKPSALDFFKKEYVWSFRYYGNSIELSMNLQEEIDSTNKLIKLNGEEN